MLFESSKVNWIKNNINRLLKYLITKLRSLFWNIQCIVSVSPRGKSLTLLTVKVSEGVSEISKAQFMKIDNMLLELSKLHAIFGDQRWPDVVNDRPILS